MCYRLLLLLSLTVVSMSHDPDAILETVQNAEHRNIVFNICFSRTARTMVTY